MNNRIIQKKINEKYPFGFQSSIDSDVFSKGLNKHVITAISNKKQEPHWMLENRLHAYEIFQKMKEPHWSSFKYPFVNYQNISYFASPKKQEVESLDQVDPKILNVYKKLGIPLEEQKILAGVKGATLGNNFMPGMNNMGRSVAVDAVFDSTSVITTFKKELKKKGIIFSSLSSALQEYPDLVKKYMFSVVPMVDNFFAALNAAVFSDGTFVYIPKGIQCPMELSTYFRINTENLGQFERTLIVADEDSTVSYLEGCTAPMFSTHQLHGAVVELIAHKKASIKYSTIQNWYPGDKQGKGGVYNFVTKRGLCLGDHSKISWTQVETGSALTWKYPSCILKGDYSSGEFYSVALTKYAQQADTGTKMVHIGKGTKSRIISKGISAVGGGQTYRSVVSMAKGATHARNYTSCDSLLIGDKSTAFTIPDMLAKNTTCRIEHEATTSKVDENILLYCLSRGINEEKAIALIVNGFCRQVLQNLPMEFAVEAQKLLAISLEGSVG